MKSSASCLLVALLVAAGTVSAATALELFQVPGHGAIQLAVQDGWVSSVRQPAGELPPTIRLNPKAGQPFEVMITPLWRRGDDEVIYESAIRDQTAAAAAEAQPQAVETKLVLNVIKGTDGSGYYFTATDRAPKPGEYKFMAQGQLRLGNLSLAFTVLTNDGQASVVADALQLLSTATRK